ncbi:quinol oxidase subunit 2 [Pullulanibacillus camelliae]|uniref:Quinol oxidase subunit 2 n=1 Tax=Pullulanibacillus camelliae TaxID=1707096 RepID=A0A8J2YLA5_9BACL|nr:cytochrome c oxidase subunit II transmembrane domain-containing protein [Pullulanibacillus camelliae]GGE50537.1 quinol oxidase subunit 2 [Pullulanibacillus camelliae]
MDPKGPVGEEEKHLILLTTLLIAIVVIPVIILLIYIIYRYRDTPSNTARYRPKWGDNKYLEIIWWGIPIIITVFMAYFTGKSVFALVKPPTTDVKPITIQVTSLDWKWLFQYPDQNIATVNYVDIPAGRPVQFILTSDAPMNSFWIPQLGGQEYTMPGMAMRLWLQANETGKYFGTGANFTGEGFAHMQFDVIAKTEAEFNRWVNKVKAAGKPMDMAIYNRLKQPGLVNKQTYSSYPPHAFEMTLMKNGGHYHERIPEGNQFNPNDTEKTK